MNMFGVPKYTVNKPIYKIFVAKITDLSTHVSEYCAKL
jgi:hypothetical protein